MKTGLAIIAAAIALVAGSHLLRSRRTPPTVARHHPAGAPIVLGTPGLGPTGPTKAAIKPHNEADDAHAPRLASPAATNTARRFMTAYLQWQQGHTDPHTTADLRATASTRLLAALEHGASRPAASARISPERLRHLIAGATDSRAAATVLAELERHQLLGSLAVVLHRTARGWRVTSLTR